MGSTSRRPAATGISNALNGVSLEELFGMAEQVQAVVDHPGWELLMVFVQAEIAEIDAKLDGGRDPLSQAEYAMAHGRRGGLRTLEDAATAILAKAERRLLEQQAKHEGAAEAAPDRSM